MKNGKKDLNTACSIQVKSLIRLQGNPQIFQFHAFWPISLLYSDHMTENKAFHITLLEPLLKSIAFKYTSLLF